MRVKCLEGGAHLRMASHQNLRLPYMQLPRLNNVQIFMVMGSPKSLIRNNRWQHGWAKLQCSSRVPAPADDLPGNPGAPLSCEFVLPANIIVCLQCAAHATTAKPSLAHLRVAVAAARGEADVDAHDAPVARAVDARVLNGVPDHHTLRARQHAQRLRQRAAVAPPLVLCTRSIGLGVRLGSAQPPCACASGGIRSACASAPQSQRRSSSAQISLGLGLRLGLECARPTCAARPAACAAPPPAHRSRTAAHPPLKAHKDRKHTITCAFSVCPLRRRVRTVGVVASPDNSAPAAQERRHARVGRALHPRAAVRVHALQAVRGVLRQDAAVHKHCAAHLHAKQTTSLQAHFISQRMTSSCTRPLREVCLICTVIGAYNQSIDLQVMELYSQRLLCGHYLQCHGMRCKEAPRHRACNAVATSHSAHVILTLILANDQHQMTLAKGALADTGEMAQKTSLHAVTAIMATITMASNQLHAPTCATFEPNLR